MKSKSFTALGVALAALAFSGSYAVDAAPAAKGTKAPIHGDAMRGGDLAVKWCLSCHGLRKDSANDQIPTFAAIAKGPQGEAGVLRAFLHVPHKPMPPLQLTNQEIEDLAVFIESLK